MEKRGQIAIIVIVALMILAAAVLLFMYRKDIVVPGSDVFSPSSFLRTCIEPTLKENIEMLSKNGGYSQPEGYLTYQGENIKYLCYTNEYYKTCVVQQPMIKEHFEEELNNLVGSKAESCMQNLKNEYESRGYDVSMGSVDSSITINPGNILVSLNTPLSIKKESTQTFSGLDVELDSEMYDLLLLTDSIISYETTFGDSETTLYMRYYPDLKIEKTKLSDGSKVYTLSNVVSKDSFRFATRSLSWPSGYGLE